MVVGVIQGSLYFSRLVWLTVFGFELAGSIAKYARHRFDAAMFMASCSTLVIDQWF